ncbi:MAG: GMC oxidoreductase [Thermoplasmata archaeon]
MRRFDVVIIGTGAGGGTLAHALAETGKEILLLERGDFLVREKENWSPHQVFVENRYKTREVWKDGAGNEFHPANHYYVGGNTKLFGAATLRMRKEDFGEVKHHDGTSPAWPIRYEDMEPHYTQAEELYHVHGLRGSDPTEPPASGPFPYPPVRHEPRIQEIYDDLTERGTVHPFPLPLALILDEDARHRSPCIKCNTCDGFPCLVNGKADAHVVCVEPALKHPNVTLITDAMATRLRTDPNGKRVSEIQVTHNRTEERYEGETVVVSCGAINSAALLLRSKSSRHPEGLANSSGMVGRNYMVHNNTALIAVGRKPNPTKFQKTFGINDFYFAGGDYDFPLGHIQLMGKADREMLSADMPGFVPGMALDYIATNSVDWWVTTEDLPNPKNRVEVDATGGIVLRYTPNNEEPHRLLQEELKAILHEIGLDRHLLHHELYMSTRQPIAMVPHQNGTCRMGTDPRTSVLDTDCRTHDVENLYVVDASFFPSNSAVNPALTVIANALRVADHLKEVL